MKSTQKNKVNIFFLIICFLLVLYAISLFIPLLWGIMTSLKTEFDFSSNSKIAFPDFSSWDTIKELSAINPEIFGHYNVFNYSRFFYECKYDLHVSYLSGLKLANSTSKTIHYTMGSFILNTLLYALGTSIFGTIAPCVMGYLCAKFKYKFSNFIYAFVLFVMVMPIIGNTSAMIVLLRRLNLYDNFIGWYIKSCNFASMYFLIFYALFSGISNTYAEAAYIDGASYFRVMMQIYMPLAIKTISTIILLQFVALYNDYSTPMVYLRSHFTLAWAVWYFGGESSPASVPLKIAASLTLSLPMLIIFVIFKDKLMGNISLGGIKE